MSELYSLPVTEPPLEGAEVVETYWPYDGPHDVDTVASSAAALAGLVRYLANATRPGHRDASLPYAPQLYRLLTSLTAAAGGLEQVLDQARATAQAHAEDDRLYDDRADREGADTARELATALAAAGAAGQALTARLQAAAGMAGHLGHDLPDAEL